MWKTTAFSFLQNQHKVEDVRLKTSNFHLDKEYYSLSYTETNVGKLRLWYRQSDNQVSS